jgi:dephospho-CoA kinase
MIIGISGTDGAGKGVVVDYLVEKHGFVHCSARELITTEINRLGRTVNRANMRITANELRAQFGNDYVVTQYLEQYGDSEADLIIESIRTMAEAETLKQEGGILLVVDAEQSLRYQRIMERKSESDQITFEEFCSQEAIEMNDPDPNGMQKARVMESADFTIQNNGSLEELYTHIEHFMKSVQV